MTSQKTFARILNSPEGLASVEIVSTLEKSWQDKKAFSPLSKAEKESWKQANLKLWASYTIYDHIMDGGTSLAELPTANLLLFESAKILGGKSQLADEAFLLMETANQREFLRVGELKKDKSYWQKLNEDSLLKNGHQKSLGLYISVFIFLESRGVTLIEQKKFRDFFIHFLNCRQLADDLYDWRDDLKDNIPTAVTVNLMKKFGKKKYNLSDLEVEVFINLYPHFHNYLIKTLNLASASAKKISVLEKNNFLASWAETALEEEEKRWQDYQKLLRDT
ncbi:MAG: hypothetical protein ACOYMB_01320 [Patescibacteria group bacterium]